MEWFQLSYYSLGVFTCFLICFIMAIFLGTVRGASTSTKWLFGQFLGFSFLFLGYFMAYSVYAEWGAYHRVFTGLILFGNIAFIGFTYHFPKNDFPKEAKFLLIIWFIISIAAYVHYLGEVFSLEKFYNFEAHHYNMYAGKLFALFVLLTFIYSIVILARKVLLYSGYSGKYKNKFLVGLIKFFKPEGKEAHGSKSYLKAAGFFLMVAMANVLLKTGKITYDEYATSYAVLSLLASFYMVITYINNSVEPSTFMVKLLGISLVTILLVIGFLNRITLVVNESDYDNQKITRVNAAREFILDNKIDKLPDDIQYVLVQKKGLELFHKEYSILYNKPGKELLNLDELYKWEAHEKKELLEKHVPIVKKKNKQANNAEIERLALEEIKKNFPSDMKRGYRRSGDLFTYYRYTQDDLLYEVGFSYTEYRHHTHAVVLKVFYIIVATTFLTLFLFPRFFKSSLVKPLGNLLLGVKKVNDGFLDVVVPVKTQDEIGFLAKSFNSMVHSIKEARKELQDYAENLEHKVDERTKEVQEKMEEVNKLKVQQDGDYFLTSLLAKPLFYNANKSKTVRTSFIIKQKKEFEFRNKKSELGGDICITGNLRLGKVDNYKRYTMAMNGDAMGKSMQGAGGSLVMGVVMNSIMARSASSDRIMDATPEQWLTDTYNEIHSVFKSFNGTMVISATIFLIDNETAKAWYINAEHPFSVLYRDGIATFIEKDLMLRKIGLDSEIDFQVFEYQFLPGDLLIIGSDGKDDINLTPNESYRTMNEDENLFLQIVEESEADLNKIIEIVQTKGSITDDISLLKVEISEDITIKDEVTLILEKASEPVEITIGDEKYDQISDSIYQHAKSLYYKEEVEKAINIMMARFLLDKSHSRMNRFLGLLLFRSAEYAKASMVLTHVLSQKPKDVDLWYFLSISQKKTGDFLLSLDSALHLFSIKPDHVNNLLNLSDIYRMKGDNKTAKKYAENASSLDPQNPNVIRMNDLLQAVS
jgi:HAMP domain-containing protein